MLVKGLSLLDSKESYSDGKNKDTKQNTNKEYKPFCRICAATHDGVWKPSAIQFILLLMGNASWWNCFYLKQSKFTGRYKPKKQRGCG